LELAVGLLLRFSRSLRPLTPRITIPAETYSPSVPGPKCKPMTKDSNHPPLPEGLRGENGAAQGSEERYRELFENCRDAIYVHDLSGRYILVNRAAEQLSGYQRDEILGKHYSNFIAPRHLKEARENFCLKLDVPIETTYEAEIVSRNGVRIPVEVSSRMIYENGEAVGVQGTVRDITERKRAQEILQTYSHRLIEAQEAERQNVAQELDDQITHVLSELRDKLTSLQNEIEATRAQSQVVQAIETVDEALVQIRDLSLDLRTSQLDELGLAAALRWYVNRYTMRSGIAAEVIGDSAMGTLPHEVETACFRIAQEALANTARHSRATRATVQIERRNGQLHLAVHDNGIGFNSRKLLDNATAARVPGLRGMQERALAIRGQIEINSRPGSGTDIILDVPLS
jgi:PAS domain S-box-containing protein